MDKKYRVVNIMDRYFLVMIVLTIDNETIEVQFRH